MATVPEIINDFNIYDEGNQLIGVSGEVTLPDFEAVTETISGAGILGEFDAINPGQFGAQEIEIPFRLAYGDVYSILGKTPAKLTLRGALQIMNGDGTVEQKGMRVIMQGRAKKLTSGKASAGKPMEAAVSFALTYIKIEIDGQTSVELDKLNSIYIVNGEDKLSAIKALI